MRVELPITCPTSISKRGKARVGTVARTTRPQWTRTVALIVRAPNPGTRTRQALHATWTSAAMATPTCWPGKSAPPESFAWSRATARAAGSRSRAGRAEMARRSAGSGTTSTTSCYILRPGDWNGDGFNDLLARENSGNRDLCLIRGNGHGGLIAEPGGGCGGGTRIGWGWEIYNWLLAPSDWAGNGDSCPASSPASPQAPTG